MIGIAEPPKTSGRSVGSPAPVSAEQTSGSGTWSTGCWHPRSELQMTTTLSATGGAVHSESRSSPALATVQGAWGWTVSRTG